jgi:hypothetical protein
MGTRRQKVKITCGLMALALLTGCAGCGGNVSQTTPSQELNTARKNWATKGLRFYKFTVKKNCFCPEEYAKSVTITVQNGVATNSPEHLKAHDTVEKLLDTIGEALTSKADQVDMDFHIDGYPRSFYIDQSKMIADEEYGVIVTDLTPP